VIHGAKYLITALYAVIHGAKYLITALYAVIHGARYLITAYDAVIHCARYLVPGTRYLVPVVLYLMTIYVLIYVHRSKYLTKSMIYNRKIEVCKCQYAHFAHIRLSFGCTDEKIDFGIYLDTYGRFSNF